MASKRFSVIQTRVHKFYCMLKGFRFNIYPFINSLKRGIRLFLKLFSLNNVYEGAN